MLSKCIKSKCIEKVETDTSWRCRGIGSQDYSGWKGLQELFKSAFCSNQVCLEDQVAYRIIWSVLESLPKDGDAEPLSTTCFNASYSCSDFFPYFQSEPLFFLFRLIDLTMDHSKSLAPSP